MGFRVLQVPEAATTLRKGGINLKGTSGNSLSQKARFTKSMMKLQMEMEQIFINIAQMQTQHTIILIDRGVMDAKAHTDDVIWQSTLDETGYTTIQLHKRYEAVVHLVTAAEGAEEFYVSESNNKNL